MFEGKLKILNREIPRTLLGTSPFIAAAQFGHRARLYQIDLYNNPENIFKIIKKSYDLGITGIQVIPYPPVIKALKDALNAGYDMDIIGTVRPDKELDDIQLMSDLNATSMILHADITDKKDWNFIGEKLQLIKDGNAVPGLATHMPYSTTKHLVGSPVKEMFEVYMVPVNKLGYLMDSELYGSDERKHLNQLIESLDKTVIVKKVLAAGILQPQEAFDYLKTVEFADIVTIGIASEEEAQETFSLLGSQ
ncbi:hypothetical protein [Methanobacterium sp.]|uniref:hypothetical protein n=1 Tax=Methanobacterium sp. TaxID=2164 RepID=UPI003C792284